MNRRELLALIASATGLSLLSSCAQGAGENVGLLDPPVRVPGRRVVPPTDLGFTPLASVYRVGDTFVTDYDVDAFRDSIPAGQTYFVSPTGSGSNTGLTAASPFALPSTAIGKGDCGTLVFLPGTYNRNLAIPQLTTTNCPNGLRILAVGSVNLTCAETGLVWALDSGSTYKATRSAVVNVYDAATLTAQGDHARYALAADLAACNSTPGTYYQSGSTVYVHTLDDRAPDADVFVYITSAAPLRVTGPLRVYVEGIEFRGSPFAGVGLFEATSAGAPTIVARRCKFKYGSQNGFASLGAVTVALDCEAASNDNDQWNYHAGSGAASAFKPFFLEERCIGRDGGLAAHGDIDNGSTGHDAAKGVRVACQYARTVGPLLVDVDSSRSWNLGCTTTASTAASAPQNVGVMSDTGTVMYLDSHTASGSKYGISPRSGSSILLRNASLSGLTAEVNATGTYGPY